MAKITPFILTPFGYHTSPECGYCAMKKNAKPLGDLELPKEAKIAKVAPHITIGAQVMVMSSEAYEKCMNMGFRRSGTFLYKSDMLRGCCRMYTIRTNMSYLKITKELRQVVNRFKRAIANNDEEVKPSKTFDLRSLIEAEQASSRFKTTYDLPHYTEEKYQLYKKYQTIIHKDKPEDVTPQHFINFLIQTPFSKDDVLGNEEDWTVLDNWVNVYRRDTPSAKNTRIGPTHECYYLDGKLIALSIIDVLPNSLLSVYFIWDPDYAQLSLGTLLSLREIQMCNELGIPHYYMGYYVDDCTKMRYKAKFGGEIWDVCNNVFVPLDKVDAFLKGDRLWTLGDVVRNEEGKLHPESNAKKEPFTYLNGAPAVYTKEVFNGASSLYSTSEVYQVAEDAAKEIRKNLNLGKGTYFYLPLVLPGALPMTQLLKSLNGEIKMNVWDSKKRGGVFKRLDEMLDVARLMAIESLRMLGFEMVPWILLMTM